jgi:hypothetical protein
MRQCVHHKRYISGGVDCDIHGTGLLVRCQGCPEFSRVSRGLGDTVAKAAAAVGVTPERVEAMTGKPCNCPEAKAFWNQLFPYNYQGAE